MKTFHIGGIHPKENKITAGFPIEQLPYPNQVQLMLSQHIGKPSQCIVKVGDHVNKYQLIAEDSGFVSACLHSPISGTVKAIERKRNPQGYYVDVITINADENANDEATSAYLPNPIQNADDLSAQEIIDIIDKSGIVGMGGAAFPTRVKLSPPEGMTPTIVIINGAECEPYLTCDDALMQTYPEEIIKGIELIMKAVGVVRAKIGIEKNKPKAIKALSKILNGRSDIEIIPLKMKYPQGGEKQLIEALLHKEVPSGALPIATGAIVQNVATAYAVYKAVCRRIPLVERVVTVTGPNVKKPGNYLVTLGTPIREIIDAAGGLPNDTGKVIAGGPMMGKAIVNLDAPSTKGLSGLLILPDSQSHRKQPENCIRCSNCVDACPMGLEPYLLMALSEHEDWEEIEKSKVMNCIECGSCSYICPANRPLLDMIRFGKQTVGKIIRQRNNQ